MENHIVTTPNGTEAAHKIMEQWLLQYEEIKPELYKMIHLSDFFNKSDENKDEFNIRNFIKTHIIELHDMMGNECWSPSSKCNIDLVTNDRLDWGFMEVVADRINGLFKLLNLVEQNADLIPFIEERYEIYYQLLNK